MSKPETDPNPRPSAKAAREARLAQALRQNLKRRKTVPAEKPDRKD
jgi:hypothetical protein